MNININPLEREREHKLIIGENYNALKALLITHKNKIDVIYIDPPYNTETAKKDGNQSSKEESKSSFVYKDKYARVGYLTMIKQRINMAKDLLSNEGVIFVSIDDNEQAYIKVLMDEVFGEENFVANMIIKANSKSQKIGKPTIGTEHEYLLVYKKNVNSDPFRYIENQNYLWFEKNFVKYHALVQRWKTNKEAYLTKSELNILVKMETIFESNKGLRNYKFLIGNQIIRTDNLNMTHGKGNNFRVKCIINKKVYFLKPPKHGWPKKEKFLSSGLFTEEKNDLIISFPEKIEESQNVFFYSFLNWPSNFKEVNGVYINESNTNSSTILNAKTKQNSLVLHFQQSSRELESILNGNYFDYPKVTKLLKFIFSLIKNKNATYLDFFAGSGTTGHAVLDLNREDGGKRQFILVTNNENQIAENVTYARLHRIITGRSSENIANFSWLKNHQPYIGAKLRTILINDKVQIGINSKNTNDLNNILKRAQSGLRLLDPYYNNTSLNLYYDLAGLNPLEKDHECN